MSRAPGVLRAAGICALLAALAPSHGCSENTLIGVEAAGAAGRAGAGGVGTGGTGAEAGIGANAGSAGESAGSGGEGGGVCVTRKCQGKTYTCGDCLDNDADGLVDAMDPECLGSCDDTEDALNGGLSDQGEGCRQDCYFDRDNGGGNDGCYWSQQCDALEPAAAECPYDPKHKIPGAPGSCAELAAAQSDACLNFCLPLTPNGCDCFGCCELPAGSGEFRYVGAEKDGQGTCTVPTIDDPVLCPACTPVGSCLNSCGHCELCVGKTTLPADCDGSTTGQCPAGVTACGLPGQSACPADKYCLTGCCFDIIE